MQIPLQCSYIFDEWPLTLIFCPAYNNGGATLTRPMPGQACVFKAFRASLTLVPAGYIGPADAAPGGHLPLGPGRPVVQTVPLDDDRPLPGRQADIHAAAHLPLGVPGIQLLQHGVIHRDDIHQRKSPPLPRRLQRVRQGDLTLQLFSAAEIHEDFIRYPLLADT